MQGTTSLGQIKTVTFVKRLSVIQGDQKVSVHLMITTQKVTSNVQSVPASLQTFIDTPNCVLEYRVQYITVRIPNVFCDGHLQIISGIVVIHIILCTLIIRCTDNF
jgi:hypothetical protein